MCRFAAPRRPKACKSAHFRRLGTHWPSTAHILCRIAAPPRRKACKSAHFTALCPLRAFQNRAAHSPRPSGELTSRAQIWRTPANRVQQLTNRHSAATHESAQCSNSRIGTEHRCTPRRVVPHTCRRPHHPSPEMCVIAALPRRKACKSAHFPARLLGAHSGRLLGAHSGRLLAARSVAAVPHTCQRPHHPSPEMCDIVALPRRKACKSAHFPARGERGEPYASSFDGNCLRSTTGTAIMPTVNTAATPYSAHEAPSESTAIRWVAIPTAM
jgi:hypothetical protein